MRMNGSEECPEGTHAYALGCGYKTPEPTCSEPNPVAETHMLCDYSACYCDSPTIRDENTGKCVPKEECTPQKPPTPTLLPPFEDLVPPSSETPSKQEVRALTEKPSNPNVPNP